MRHHTTLILLIILFCASITSGTHAQLLQMGLKGGMNLSEIDVSSGELSTENSSGFFLGPVAHVKIPFLGLGANIAALYNQNDTEIDGQTLRQHSIDIPLNLRISLHLGPLASFFAEAGPQIAFSLGKPSVSLQSDNLRDVNWDVDETNLSFNVGGGLSIWHIQVGLTYSIPFGNTGQFTWHNAAHELLHSPSQSRHWQISAALLF